MNSIWYSLAWKEWHEHKWKLAAITAVLWGITGVVLLFGKPVDALGLASGLAMECMAPLAVFVGLGEAASERARGTLPFLQASPVSMRRTAVTKLVAGFFTLVVAVVLGELLIWACLNLFGLYDTEYRATVRVFERESLTGRWYFDCFLYSSALATSLFIWSAAAGVNRKDEVSAGAWALAAMAGWGLLVSSGISLFDKNRIAIPEWLHVIAISTIPGMCVRIIGRWNSYFGHLGLGVALGIHGALAVWYVLRFGRIEEMDVRSPQPAIRDAVRAGWLAAPRQSALTAIAWKQFRESVPLVLCGIAGVVGISILFAWSDEPGNFFTGPDRFARFAELTAGVTAVIGFIVAVVVGVGVCLHDSSPGLATFWRSRPINVDLWFWTKFFTGMAVLIVAFYTPLLVVAFAMHKNPVGLLTHPDAIPAQLAAFTVFAAAVITTCLVRHAVYAAILSMAGVYIGALIGLGLWYVAGLVGWVDLPRHGWMEPEDNAPVIFGMALSFVASTLIGWLAVRYDWGRKGRY